MGVGWEVIGAGVVGCAVVGASDLRVGNDVVQIPHVNKQSDCTDSS